MNKLPSLLSPRTTGLSLKRLRPHFQSRPDGFTLTELLVVLAVLALLAVLPLPVAARAREQARDTTCKSNLRQLSLGVLLYVDENHDLMPWPPQYHTDGRSLSEFQVFAPGGPGDTAALGLDVPDQLYLDNADSFAIHAESGSVFPYVTGSKKSQFNMTSMIKTVYPVYRCPGTGIKGEVLRVNYSLNSWFNPTKGHAGVWNATLKTPAGVRASAIINPSEKVMLVQESPQSMKETGFTGSPSATTARVSHTTHDGKVNVSMSDGHVEEVTNDQLMDMIRVQPNRYFEPYLYR